MMNTFMNQLKQQTNYSYTENGALAHKSTNSAVYDLFALGGAYRNRSDEDAILLFKNAIEEDTPLALKALFYLRDVRGGQGERRFFRTCFKWLISEYPTIAKRLLAHVPEYGRWDDLIYTTIDTPLYEDAFKIISAQLNLDVQSKTPSLLGKWMPSENASSEETKRVARKLRNDLKMTARNYRKMLSSLRERIKVVERLMSTNRWDEIEFDKVPSRAGLIYKNAFARRDIIAERYKNFAEDKDTKVNADTLYPYDIVEKVFGGSYTHYLWGFNTQDLSDTDRKMIEKYWYSQKDYFEGRDAKMICVCDTSGSMGGRPINTAIGLSIYCAERLSGPFKDHYVSFASRPQLIKVEGVDFVDKVKRIYETNLVDNTNLEATFDLLLDVSSKAKKEDIPDTVLIISDMQIDEATSDWNHRGGTQRVLTDMEKIRQKWSYYGLKCPKLVYWNVNASRDTILDGDPEATLVSGSSPSIFKQIMTGKTGFDLMLEILNSKRYEAIT